MKTTKKISALFLVMLLVQTPARPIASLVRETMPGVNKEESPQKEVEEEPEVLPKETEEFSKEGEEILKEKEIPEIPTLEDRSIEESLMPLTQRESVEEKTAPFSPKELSPISRGPNGEVFWEYNQENKTLTFTTGGKLSIPIENMYLLGAIDLYNLEKIVFTDFVQLPPDCTRFFGRVVSGNQPLQKLEKITGFEFIEASEVETMNRMFQTATLIESFNLSNFKTSSLLIDMNGMFSHSSGLKEVTFAETGQTFDATSVTSIESMFSFNSSLEKIDLSKLETTESLKSMGSLFYRNTNLKKVTFGGAFDVSGVTNMGYMFYETLLEKLDLSELNTSNALTRTSNMFAGATNLSEVIFGEDFDTSNVTDASDMFSGADNLKTITFGDKFKLTDATNLKDPEEDHTYTGRWTSLDGTLVYETSAELLAEGTKESGLTTFVWEKRLQPDYLLKTSTDEVTLTIKEAEEIHTSEDLFSLFGAEILDNNEINPAPQFIPIPDTAIPKNLGAHSILLEIENPGLPFDSTDYSQPEFKKEVTLTIVPELASFPTVDFQPKYELVVKKENVHLSIMEAEKIHTSEQLFALFGAEVLDSNGINPAPNLIPIPDVAALKNLGEHRILLEIEDPVLSSDLTDYSQPEFKKEVTLTIVPELGSFPTVDLQPKYELVVEKEILHLSSLEAEKITDSELLTSIGVQVKDLNNVFASPKAKIVHRNKTSDGFSVGIGVENPYKKSLADQTDYNQVYRQVNVRFLSSEEEKNDKEEVGNQSNSEEKTKEKLLNSSKSKEGTKDDLPETGEKSELLWFVVGELLLASILFVTIRKRKRKRSGSNNINR